AEKCHWNLETEIRRKSNEVYAIEHGDVGLNRRMANVRRRLDEAQEVDRYCSRLTQVKVQLDLAKTAPVKYPIDRLEMLIGQLSFSKPDRSTIDQLNRFGSKWSSRLPAGIKDAIKALGYPHRAMVDDRLTLSWEDAQAIIRELSDATRALDLEKQQEIAN